MKRVREDEAEGEEHPHKAARIEEEEDADSAPILRVLPEIFERIAYAVAPSIMPMDKKDGLDTEWIMALVRAQAPLKDLSNPAEQWGTIDPFKRQKLAAIGERELRAQLYALTTMGMVCRAWFNRLDWKAICVKGILPHLEDVRSTRPRFLDMARLPRVTQRQAFTLACYGLACTEKQRLVFKFRPPPYDRDDDVGRRTNNIRKFVDWAKLPGSEVFSRHVLTNFESGTRAVASWLSVITVADFVSRIHHGQPDFKAIDDRLAAAEKASYLDTPGLVELACMAIGVPYAYRMHYATIGQLWSYEKRAWLKDNDIAFRGPTLVTGTLDRWRATEAHYVACKKELIDKLAGPYRKMRKAEAAATEADDE